MEGGDGFDWREDAQDSYDLALAAMRARKFGLAVRHGHKGCPIEVVVSDGQGQWAVIDLPAKRALVVAQQLIDYAMRELGE